MTFKTLPKRTDTRLRRISGFKFFDQPFAVCVLNAAVESPGDNGFPIVERNFGFQMDFGLVGGIFRATFLQNLRMQFRAEAEAIPAFAAFKTDATNAGVLRQFADGDG